MSMRAMRPIAVIWRPRRRHHSGVFPDVARFGVGPVRLAVSRGTRM